MMTATRPPAALTPARPPALHRLWRGREADPRWVRPAFLALLLLTGLAYLWNLGASGYANSFYSAAVQAGSESWKAFFFGSSDAANSITVDKPPAALWPMALSVRLFGLGSWQILLPEVLMGVATVGVVYAAVRRRFSPAAGLTAGAVLALTPVAALMFRFNNPDALLALLMTVTVHCVLRALEEARTAWLVGAGAAVGLAFLTKTLQAFLILPPLALVYAVCAPTPLRRRLGQLALAGLTVVLAGGWWVAIVEWWPASSRPYIGGSQNNSFLELTFGYNGLGRLNGEETGSVGGGGGGRGGGGWGETGIDRMFAGNIGGQIAWLLPAALLLLLAGLVLTRRAARTDTARAAFLVWGGALLVTAGIFSFMAGIFHEYYTVALAPYVAALVGMGSTMLWEERAKPLGSAALAGTLLLTAWWSYTLLGRSEGYQPWLRVAVPAAGFVAAAGLLVANRTGRAARAVALGAAGLGFASALAGPAAYTVTTLGEGHAGSIVTAGPAVAGGRGGPGGFPGGGGEDGRTQPPGGGQRGQDGRGGPGNGTPPAGFPGGGGTAGGQGDGFPDGAGDGTDGNGPGGGTGGTGGTGGGKDGTGFPGAGGGGQGRGGGMGGLLNGADVGSETAAALTENADDYTWAAAAIGSQNAASYQLATGKPVMAVGGFNGSDPSPTLAQFKQYVADGRIHWFISGGGTGGGAGAPGGGGAETGTAGAGGGTGGPGGGTSAEVSAWVQETFTEVTVGGATLYDLTDPQ